LLAEACRGQGGGAADSAAAPGKLGQLRYGGYSAEFLDRVVAVASGAPDERGANGEPNGNIPHKHAQGEFRAKSPFKGGEKGLILEASIWLSLAFSAPA